jgi:hypothetical protein
MESPWLQQGPFWFRRDMGPSSAQHAACVLVHPPQHIIDCWVASYHPDALQSPLTDSHLHTPMAASSVHVTLVVL